jgi:hypothetical protein
MSREEGLEKLHQELSQPLIKEAAMKLNVKICKPQKVLVKV